MFRKQVEEAGDNAVYEKGARKESDTDHDLHPMWSVDSPIGHCQADPADDEPIQEEAHDNKDARPVGSACSPAEPGEENRQRHENADDEIDQVQQAERT